MGKEKTDKIHILVDVLTRLASSDASLGVSELGRELSKNKVYIHRMMSSLESSGWVTKNEASQRYVAGDELINFALLLSSKFYLSKITLPYLYELSNLTNETTALSVRVGYERVLVQVIPSKDDKSKVAVLGQHFPLWLAATGKSMAAFLSGEEINTLVKIMKRELPEYRGLNLSVGQFRSELKEIKNQGYALSVGDYVPDVCVLAAPLFNPKKKVIGALVVRGSSPPFTLNLAKKYSPIMLRMTHQINKELQE